MASPARAFPFDRLPKLGREQVRALAMLRTALDARQLEQLCAAAAPWLGAQVSATLELAQPIATREALREHLRAPMCALLFEGDVGGPRHRIALDCRAEDAAYLVHRVLGGDGTLALAHLNAALDDTSRGVLAYLAARIVAACYCPMPLCAVLVTPDALADALDADLLIAPIVVHIGERRIAMRAFVPCAALRDSRAAPTPADFSRLDGVALTLCVDAGSATLPLTAAESLAPGDVVVLDASALLYEGGDLRGKLALRVLGGSAVLNCSAHDRTISIDSIDPREDTHMTTGHIVTKAEHAGAALANDAPIELRVELARFSLTLGELAHLTPGDVLTTGRRLGEHVTLRAGTRALAEGELVDVDGEIGVRILRTLAARDQSEIV